MRSKLSRLVPRCGCGRLRLRVASNAASSAHLAQPHSRTRQAEAQHATPTARLCAAARRARRLRDGTVWGCVLATGTSRCCMLARVYQCMLIFCGDL